MSSPWGEEAGGFGAHARCDAIHLRPTGEHAHDTHAPAEGGEGEEEAEEAERHDRL